MKNFYIDDINKTVNFNFSFDEDLKNEIKSISDSRWNDELKEWIVPINIFTKNRIVKIIKQYGFVKKDLEEKDVAYNYNNQSVDYAHLKSLCDVKNLGYTPRDYQLDCLAYQLEKKDLIIGDDVGVGKCEYIENKVFTPYGRKRIGDIKKGDFVIGSDGKKTKVLEVHPQKDLKALYRVTFNDGFSALFTEEHLFNVSSNSSGYNNKRIKAKEQTLSVKQLLSKTDVIKYKGLGHNAKKEYSRKTYYKSDSGANVWQIPITKPIHFENNFELKIEPYLLGFVLGDGCIRDSGKAYLDFHKDDFEEVLKNVDYKEISSKNNCRKASLLNLNKHFVDLKLNGKLSYYKFIPDIYKYSSIEDRIALIQGLMDSDGTVSGSNNSFCTSSLRLFNDFIEVVHSVGGICRRIKPSYKKYSYKGDLRTSKHLSYRCSVKLPNTFTPFRLKRKLDKFRFATKYPVGRYIKDISFEKFGESVCISVDAPNNLYVTEHGIVTHNTAESVFYTEVTEKFPCLVVTPGSVKYNWQKKWTEIANNENRTISVIESKGNNNWNADVVIINYDILAQKAGKGATTKFDELKTIDWKMAIFDEAHFLKEKKSQRSQATKIILDNLDGNIQFLTGTAIMSKPIEIWNLLILLGKSKDIALDWKQFITRYCGGYRGKFGWVTDGATNIIELNKKLRESCYIRREKSDVLKELPKVIKQVVELPITNIRNINKANNDFINYIKELKGDEAAEKAMEAEHLVAISELRKLAINGKLKAIEQYLKDWKTSTDKKLLIFGVHKEPLEILSNKFKSKLISGGVTSKKKQEIVDGWINSKEQFLFANGDAAGTGVDGLQKVCSNMIIIELPWRSSDLEQWIGRIDRSGQIEPPNINFLLNYKTIDKEMWEMLEIKDRVMSAVNKGIDVKRNKSGLKQIMKKFLKRVV